MNAHQCLLLAERHLTAARQAAHDAARYPDDFRADFASRVHARRALHHADQARAALHPAAEPGPIIRTRS